MSALARLWAGANVGVGIIIGTSSSDGWELLAIANFAVAAWLWSPSKRAADQ